MMQGRARDDEGLSVRPPSRNSSRKTNDEEGIPSRDGDDGRRGSSSPSSSVRPAESPKGSQTMTQSTDGFDDLAHGHIE